MIKEKEKDIIKKMNGKVTGTTNYVSSEFNRETKLRKILFGVGVPLHKIIYTFVDIFYNYINNKGSSEGKILHIHAVLKPEPESRPETPVICKLEGGKTKKIREENYRNIIDGVLEQFDGFFNQFIKDGRLTSQYRKDTNSKELLTAYKDYLDDIKPNLIKLKGK